MSNYIWGFSGRPVDPWADGSPPAAPPANPAGAESTVEQVVDMTYLLGVYDRLRREGGPAPGIDGIGYDRMGRAEAAAVLRAKREAVLRGRYRPDPVRPVRIAKASGGYRTLRLPTVPDRVLYAGLNDHLVPYWERFFSPRSHGFRPRRSRFTLLAEMDHEITTTGRTVLVVDDVRKAFDNVRLADCLTAHREHLTGERLLTHIHTALRGHDLRRVTGIDQGNAYSPTALQVLLDNTHDRPLDHQGDGQHPWWFRYADNLIYLTHHVSEGRHVRQLVQGLLQATGLTLKGTDDDVITDIQQHPVEVLGLDLRMEDGRVAYAIPDRAWEQLHEAMLECHWRLNPPAAARSAVRGWLEAQGPTFENLSDAILCRIYRTGTRNGFRELDGQDALRRYAQDAFRRWECLRHTTSQQTRMEGHGTGAFTP